jgi:hypothetical protein
MLALHLENTSVLYLIPQRIATLMAKSELEDSFGSGPKFARHELTGRYTGIDTLQAILKSQELLRPNGCALCSACSAAPFFD